MTQFAGTPDRFAYSRVIVHDDRQVARLVAPKCANPLFLRFLLFQDEIYSMHRLFAKADRLSGEVIAAATLVHRIMGPGFLLGYIKLLNVPLGMVFNFHEVKLVDGIPRLILPGTNKR